MLFAQRAQPAQQMGITAQLGKLVHLGESGVQIGEETMSRRSVVGHGFGSERGGQDADVVGEDLLEAGGVSVHGMGGEDKRERWATARAYSRQTSWGASST